MNSQIDEFERIMLDYLKGCLLYTSLRLYADGSDPWGHPDTDWFNETLKSWSPQTYANATIDLSLIHIYIYQDKEGYLWIGTTNGLARYDGFRLQPFRADYKNLNLLTDVYKRQMFIG